MEVQESERLRHGAFGPEGAPPVHLLQFCCSALEGARATLSARRLAHTTFGGPLRTRDTDHKSGSGMGTLDPGHWRCSGAGAPPVCVFRGRPCAEPSRPTRSLTQMRSSVTTTDAPRAAGDAVRQVRWVCRRTLLPPSPSHREAPIFVCFLQVKGGAPCAVPALCEKAAVFHRR